MFPTLEQFVGNTPLVRLQRIPGRTSNVILAKLEGNNPAGSVKDRPALAMVLGAERRGEIRRGDTLIDLPVLSRRQPVSDRQSERAASAWK